MKTTPCPNCGHPINPAAMLGTLGGSTTSDKKTKAARANGRAGGGRPVGSKDSKPRQATLDRLLRQAHERQFNGEDWQQVANDLWTTLPGATDDDFTFLSSSPDPGCECEFCATADWRD